MAIMPRRLVVMHRYWEISGSTGMLKAMWIAFVQSILKRFLGYHSGVVVIKNGEVFFAASCDIDSAGFDSRMGHVGATAARDTAIKPLDFLIER